MVTNPVIVCLSSFNSIHRGSYMSAPVLINLLNEMGKSDKIRGLQGILSFFRNEYNKFNKQEHEC